MVTCYKKWILYDNRERSASWLDKDEAPKHSPKPKIHEKKLMLTAWWKGGDLIHYSFMKPGQSITAGTYCNQLDNVMKNLVEKQSRLMNRDRPILLYDNVRPRTANQAQLKILKLDLETINHPPYSMDLSSTGYHFFREFDNFLQEKIFISQ